MVAKQDFQNVAFTIPLESKWDEYLDYSWSFYSVNAKRSGLVRIGDQDWPEALFILSARFDTVSGVRRYQYIRRDQNSNLPWPPVKKLVGDQLGLPSFVKANEGDLPVIYGEVEVTPKLGINNFPRRGRPNSQYIDYLIPSSGAGWDNGVQSLWFITGTQGDPQILYDSDSTLQNAWDFRVKPTNEPIVRAGSIEQVFPNEEYETVEIPLSDTQTIEGGIRITAQTTTEYTYTINNSDSWQVFNTILYRAEISETEARPDTDVVTGQSAILSITIDDGGDDKRTTTWDLETVLWWRVPTMLSPGKTWNVTVSLAIPRTAYSANFLLITSNVIVKRAVDYSNFLMASVNGVTAPTVFIRGKNIRLPDRSRLITTGPKRGLIELPDSITSLTTARGFAADPVWCALDILLDVFQYTLNDIDYPAFFAMSRTVKAPVNISVDIQPSPIETVAPLLSPINAELVQRNGIFTFENIQDDVIRYTFGKGDRASNPIVDRIVDRPPASVNITWGDCGYAKIERFAPEGVQSLNLNGQLTGTSDTITLPYEEKYDDAVFKARELVWPRASETIKVTLGPKASILKTGDRIYFQENAPNIVSAEDDGTKWTITLDGEIEATGVYVERNPIDSEVEGILITQGDDKTVFTTVANVGVPNAYVVGSAVIIPSLGQVPANVDQIDFETTLPYKVISTSSTSRLGIDVTLEKEDDPRRDDFLFSGLYEGRGDANKPENPLAEIDEWPELDIIVENVDDVRLPDIPPLPPLPPPPIEDEEDPEVVAPEPGVVNLVASNIGTTTATLTLTGWDNDWRYSQNLQNSSCVLVTGNNIVRLTGLDPDTEYRYSAYQPAGCDIDNTLASTTFTTNRERGSVRLLVDNITTNSARLILLNWSEPWRYHNVDDQTVCAFVSGEDLTEDLASTAPLHQLETCTEYTFVAYNARGCFPDAEIARATFTTFGCVMEEEPTLRLTERGLVFFKAVLDDAPTSWRRELSLPNGDIVRECRLTTSPDIHYTGLEPGTTYILRAYSSESCDPENELDALTVTTIDAPPPLPVELKITNITSTTATATICNYNQAWTLTNAPSGFNNQIDRTPTITNSRSASINLTGLIPNQTYWAQAFPFGADLSSQRLASANYKTLPAAIVRPPDPDPDPDPTPASGDFEIRGMFTDVTLRNTAGNSLNVLNDLDVLVIGPNLDTSNLSISVRWGQTGRPVVRCSDSIGRSTPTRNSNRRWNGYEVEQLTRGIEYTVLVHQGTTCGGTVIKSARFNSPAAPSRIPRRGKAIILVSATSESSPTCDIRVIIDEDLLLNQITRTPQYSVIRIVNSPGNSRAYQTRRGTIPTDTTPIDIPIERTGTTIIENRIRKDQGYLISLISSDPGPSAISGRARRLGTIIPWQRVSYKGDAFNDSLQYVDYNEFVFLPE